VNLGLDGKKVLITGSSRGIGFAIAKSLHSEGCHVALNARQNQDLLQAVKTLPGSIGITGDVTNLNEANIVVSETIEKFGSIDILICNVGSGHSVPPGEESLDEWQRVFAQNLWSTTNTIESARSALSSSQGVIICISSICGHEVIPGAPVTYSAAKAALNAYVRGISRPLGTQGVRIVAVAPGNINFPGSVWEKKINESAEDVNAFLKENVSLSTLGVPDDVANLVSFLASSKASFATGSIWTLDGGQIKS